MARFDHDRQTGDGIGGGPTVAAGTPTTERPTEATIADRNVGTGAGGA